MIRGFLKKSPFVLGFIPYKNLENQDVVVPTTKTAQEMLKRKSKVDNETGWDRLYMMFSVDEFGHISTEMNTVYQAGFLGLFFGAIYGSINESRQAYENFMRKNQATAFDTHLQAKKELQNSVTNGFARGAFRWGWRLGLFTTAYMGINTCISVYRGKSSILEYVAAGGVTGAMYKFNMGLTGMTAGAVVGGVLGSIAGGISLAILKATGTTMEEVRFWQYKWRESRDETILASIRMASQEQPTQLEIGHQERFGSNIDLSVFDDIEKKENTQSQKPAAKEEEETNIKNESKEIVKDSANSPTKS